MKSARHTAGSAAGSRRRKRGSPADPRRRRVTEPRSLPRLRLRLRVYCGSDIALGPGKADLLEAIERTGSLSQAARELGMSYMRAWTLLKAMSLCFDQPLVSSLRGGRQGGRAEITENGKRILVLYRDMTARGVRAMAPGWRAIREKLRRKK